MMPASDLSVDELAPSVGQESSEQIFTFGQARRANFVDEDSSKLAADDSAAAAAPASASSSSAPAPALPPKVLAPTGLGNLDLSAPAPQTKTIAPPRNHILTVSPFKVSGGGEAPGPRCGFTATLMRASPSSAPFVLLYGGSNSTELLSEARVLHVSSRSWSVTPSPGGAGPGARFGHTASVLGTKVYIFGGLTYSSTFLFASPSAASSASKLDAEEEDERARKKLVASRLAEKLSGLSVTKPSSSDSHGSGFVPSPKLVDAAGSPGGGVGHEDEDADQSVETVDIKEKKKKTGLGWLASATGKGLWKATKAVGSVAAKSTKATGKLAGKVGHSLYPARLVALTWGAPAPKTKAEQYGVSSDAALDPGVPEEANARMSFASQGYATPATPSSAPTPRAGGGSYGASAGVAKQSKESLFSSADFRRGEVPCNSTHAFDFSTLVRGGSGLSGQGEWRAVDSDSSSSPPPAPRYFHSACAFPGEGEDLGCFYVFGGCLATGYAESCSDLWRARVLPSGELQWAQLKPSGRGPGSRHGHSASNVGHGYMLVFGGVNEDAPSVLSESESVTKRFNDSWIYDTKKNSWHALTTYGCAPTARGFHQACIQGADGRFLTIYAGETASGSSDMVALDLNTLAWSRPLHEGTFDVEMHAGVALEENNQILTFGGLSASEGLLAEAQLLSTLEVQGQRDTFTENQVKIVVVGARGVGKTSLIRRFVEDRFISAAPGKSPGLGAAYRTVLTLMDGKLLKIHVHDVASDSTLASLATEAFRDADGAMLVFDRGDPESLESIDSWADQIRAMQLKSAAPAGGPAASPTASAASSSFSADERPREDDPPPSAAVSAAAASPLSSPCSSFSDASSPSSVSLVLLANKCDKSRTVPRGAGEALAKKLGAQYVRTSAKDSENVDSAFLALAKKIMRERNGGKSGKATGGCVIC